MIEVKGIGKTFQSGARATTALAPLDLRIEDGEFVSFIGPSGCGKSTLLNMHDRGHRRAFVWGDHA